MESAVAKGQRVNSSTIERGGTARSFAQLGPK